MKPRPAGVVTVLILLFSMGHVMVRGGEVPLSRDVAFHTAFDGNAREEVSQCAGDIFGATLTTDNRDLPDNAYHFSGVDSHIDFNDIPPLNIRRFTLCAWIKLERIDPFQRYVIFSKGAHVVELRVENSRLAIGFSGKEELFFSHSILRNDRWSHACFTVDEEREAVNVHLFVNGVHDGSGYKRTSLQPDGNGFWIGNRFGYPYLGILGSIADVKGFNRALNPSEILTLFHSESGYHK